MIELFRNIVCRIWQLVSNTQQTWDIVAAEQKSVAALRKEYVFPLIAFCVVVTFLFTMLYADENAFQSGFVQAIIEGIALIGGYFVAKKISILYLQKHNINANRVACETIIAYSYSTIFVINVVVCVCPSLFFLKILYIHSAFLVWEGLRAMCGIEEEKRENMVIVFALTVILSPVLIRNFIRWMLPNI
jgi:hypothetical protein